MSTAIIRSYSHYVKMKGPHCIVIPSDKIDAAKAIIHKQGHYVDYNQYLFENGYAIIQDANNDDFDRGWSIKLFAVNDKSLEKLAVSLDLPFK